MRGTASLMYSTCNEMLEQEQKHVGMCRKILNDMKESELPLSIQEQNHFLFMSFFKDREILSRKVQNSVKQLAETDGQDSYPLPDNNKFDWNIYQLIKHQFKDETSKLNIGTYNTLLFIAMRPNRHDVVTDILQDLGLKDILNHEKHIMNEMNTTPNRETLELLLDYFSSQAYKEMSENQNSILAFSKIVNYLADSNSYHIRCQNHK